jgi:nucleotide-binding universal stress UspA family protein
MSTHLRSGAVVVGVDGSPSSDAAVEWAATYAAMSSRPLVVASAAGRPSAGDVIGTNPVEARQRRRTTARQAIDHALRRVRRVSPRLHVDETTPMQDAREMLVDLSEQAAMVVVGTRGHGGVTALLLGSVSAAVVDHAHCPVAVVRPSEDREEAVRVGVSGDGSDRAALELAAELASVLGRPLRLVHAWSTGEPLAEAGSPAQRAEVRERHQRLVAEATAGLAEKYPDVAIDTDLVDATPARALVDASAASDVVVVGSRGKTGVGVYLGSVSRWVVEHAQCTVVVARG